MRMRQLRCFVVLAEELNFTRAARRLNMSQPPLSTQIQTLEREVGAELISRTSRKVALTRAGALFLPGVAGSPGTRIRVRIMAHEVILARARPEGLSAQNILAGTVAQIVQGKGPAVTVHVRVGNHEMLARITRRAAEQMALQPGDPVHAIVKSMSVARDHVTRTAWAAG